MRSTLLTLMIPVVLLGACAASDLRRQENPNTQPALSDESPEGDPAVAGVAARRALAVRLGVDVDDIAVESTETREWSDSCLGLGGIAESCLTVITPGFAITLLHDGTEYRYRTNLDGTSVRAE